MKPHLECLEERSLLALIAVLGTGTNPVGPLAGHVLVGTNVMTPDQPGNVDVSSYGHDTATASIALQHDPGATILPVVIVDSKNLASDASIALGIDYAINHKATVINVSFASIPQVPLTTAFSQVFFELRKATKHNIPVVFAAGNSTNNNDVNPVFPSNEAPFFKNVVSVAAYDSSGKIASFSNYGAHTVTIGALGVNVPITNVTGGAATASGTSFATPMISGLLGRIRDAMPHASLAKVFRVLRGLIDSPNTVTIDHGAIL